MSPRLNRELILERPMRVADGAGGFESSWHALGILWAEVSPGRAGLHDRAGLSAHRQTLKIIVRGAPPGASNRPQPGQRFRDGERIYLIESVQEDDASGRFLRCRAREEVMA
ncbi:MAG: head-tail adaptor protein [Rhodobacteraceae bacterium]|nr:head-tail adaptor protein [Paracoccaceae bacterium]MBR9823627.1 head-tail adaptor protein [Paracoccaceae bacterium]